MNSPRILPEITVSRIQSRVAAARGWRFPSRFPSLTMSRNIARGPRSVTATRRRWASIRKDSNYARACAYTYTKAFLSVRFQTDYFSVLGQMRAFIMRPVEDGKQMQRENARVYALRDEICTPCVRARRKDSRFYPLAPGRTYRRDLPVRRPTRPYSYSAY